MATIGIVFQLMPPKYPAAIRERVAATKNNVQDDVEFPIFKANIEWLAKSPLVLNAALNQKLPDGREIKDLEMVRDKGLGALDWLEKTLKTEYVLNAPEILKITLPSEDAEEGAALLNMPSPKRFSTSTPRWSVPRGSNGSTSCAKSSRSWNPSIMRF